jgi:hypothetical protein
MSKPLATIALLASLGVASAAEPSAPPRGREVHCTIRQLGETVLDGPCEFLAEGKSGSFSLWARGGQGELFPGVLDVSVSVVSPGVAEVRGLTVAGINSRWGEARRSKKDRACWTGSDFEVCAR